MKTSPSLLLAALLFAVCADASATNFNGKFDIVQADSGGTAISNRYYNSASKLSIYATPGPSADALREAYFRKAFVSIGYTLMTCPAGVGGTCGTLNFVSVNAANIP